LEHTGWFCSHSTPVALILHREMRRRDHTAGVEEEIDQTSPFEIQKEIAA
jgi:hypothetical protein